MKYQDLHDNFRSLMVYVMPKDVFVFISDYMQWAEKNAPVENNMKDLTPFYENLEEGLKGMDDPWQIEFWRLKINEHRNSPRLPKVAPPPIIPVSGI